MAAYCALIDPDVAVPVADLTGGQAVHHLAVFRVQDRDVLRAALSEAGVGTGVHYPTPCHRMVPYARFAHGSLPVAEAAAAQVISLPMYPHMDDEDVRYVAEQVNHLARVRRSS
jgi:dTDP-4-amino-4,6-dideoxygalactose transaminase